MINVLLTVGIFDDEATIRREAVSHRLPQLPQVGDLIVPNAAIKALINKKAEEWNMDSNIRMCYVKAIAWLEDTPVLMLSTAPSLYTMDCIYDGKIVGTVLPAVPRIGESIYVAKFDDKNWLYVSDVFYNRSVVTLELSKNRPSVYVNIGNEPISVNVDNKVDVDIVGSYHTLDVNVKGQPLDVRTRREAYD